jgi:hypothetical protein
MSASGDGTSPAAVAMARWWLRLRAEGGGEGPAFLGALALGDDG